MIKKIFINFLIIASITALLFTLKKIAINYVLPDIFLILIIFSGIFFNPMYSLFFGFFSGLALDILSYPLLGFNALIYCIIGYLSSFSKVFYIRNPLSSSILILIYIIIKALIFTFFGLIFYESDTILQFFQYKFLFETLYTLIISIPIFLIYQKIYNSFGKSKRNV